MEDLTLSEKEVLRDVINKALTELTFDNEMYFVIDAMLSKLGIDPSVEICSCEVCDKGFVNKRDNDNLTCEDCLKCKN